jgi:hypothetical protein
MKRDYRKKNQSTRKRSASHTRTFAQKAPRTARQYFSKPRQFQETWDGIAHVVSRMRTDGISLSRAAREFGVDPKLVTTLGRSALRKKSNGRYAAKKRDKLLRVLITLTGDGKQEIAIRDSRQASQLASYWDAVQKYLQTGDASALKKFDGKKITDASRKRFLLLTDEAELNRLGSAGVLSFETLYARGAR